MWQFWPILVIFGPKTPPFLRVGQKFWKKNIEAIFQGRLVVGVMQILGIFLMIPPFCGYFSQLWLFLGQKHPLFIGGPKIWANEHQGYVPESICYWCDVVIQSFFLIITFLWPFWPILVIFGPKIPPFFRVGQKFGKKNIEAIFQGQLVVGVMQILGMFLMTPPFCGYFSQLWLFLGLKHPLYFGWAQNLVKQTLRLGSRVDWLLMWCSY